LQRPVAVCGSGVLGAPPWRGGFVLRCPGMALCASAGPVAVGCWLRACYLCWLSPRAFLPLAGFWGPWWAEGSRSLRRLVAGLSVLRCFVPAGGRSLPGPRVPGSCAAAPCRARCLLPRLGRGAATRRRRASAGVGGAVCPPRTNVTAVGLSRACAAWPCRVPCLLVASGTLMVAVPPPPGRGGGCMFARPGARLLSPRCRARALLGYVLPAAASTVHRLLPPCGVACSRVGRTRRSAVRASPVMARVRRPGWGARDCAPRYPLAAGRPCLPCPPPVAVRLPPLARVWPHAAVSCGARARPSFAFDPGAPVMAPAGRFPRPRAPRIFRRLRAARGPGAPRAPLLPLGWRRVWLAARPGSFGAGPPVRGWCAVGGGVPLCRARSRPPCRRSVVFLAAPAAAAVPSSLSACSGSAGVRLVKLRRSAGRVVMLASPHRVPRPVSGLPPQFYARGYAPLLGVSHRAALRHLPGGSLWWFAAGPGRWRAWRFFPLPAVHHVLVLPGGLWRTVVVSLHAPASLCPGVPSPPAGARGRPAGWRLCLSCTFAASAGQLGAFRCLCVRVRSQLLPTPPFRPLCGASGRLPRAPRACSASSGRLARGALRAQASPLRLARAGRPGVFLFGFLSSPARSRAGSPLGGFFSRRFLGLQYEASLWAGSGSFLGRAVPRRAWSAPPWVPSHSAPLGPFCFLLRLFPWSLLCLGARYLWPHGVCRR